MTRLAMMLGLGLATSACSGLVGSTDAGPADLTASSSGSGPGPAGSSAAPSSSGATSAQGDSSQSVSLASSKATVASSAAGASSRAPEPECSETRACGSGTCCAGRCVNLDTHFDHCRACGNSCGARDVCIEATCIDATMASACAAGSVLLLLDGQRVDDGIGRAIAAALADACVAAPIVVAEANTNDPAVVSSETGLPKRRMERMLVTVGGPFVNAVVGGYERAGATPVFFDQEADPLLRVLRVTATGDVALSVEDEDLTMCHDYFLVEVFRDPVDGRLVLAVYGLYSEGTRAAGVYLQHTLIPQLALQQQEWLVMEWTDRTCDGPDVADTFTLAASGE